MSLHIKLPHDCKQYIYKRTIGRKTVSFPLYTADLAEAETMRDAIDGQIEHGEEITRPAKAPTKAPKHGKHLAKQANRYYYVRSIGKKDVQFALHTADLAEAMRLRDVIDGQIDRGEEITRPAKPPKPPKPLKPSLAERQRAFTESLRDRSAIPQDICAVDFHCEVCGASINEPDRQLGSMVAWGKYYCWRPACKAAGMAAEPSAPPSSPYVPDVLDVLCVNQAKAPAITVHQLQHARESEFCRLANAVLKGELRVSPIVKKPQPPDVTGSICRASMPIERSDAPIYTDAWYARQPGVVGERLALPATREGRHSIMRQTPCSPQMLYKYGRGYPMSSSMEKAITVTTQNYNQRGISPNEPRT